MGSENWSRALMEVGGGLDKMAAYHGQKERDEANHMRTMSLQRLRGQQSKDLADTRYQRDVDLADKRYERDLGLADKANDRRLDDRSYQERRLDDARRKEIRAANAAQVKSIDMEIGKLGAMLDEARLKGEVMDEAMVAELQRKSAMLEAQKVNLQYKGMLQLRELGDPLYKDKDDYDLMGQAGYLPDEIKAIRSRREGGDAPEKTSNVRPYDEWQEKYESGDYKGAPKDDRKLDSGEDSAEDSTGGELMAEETPSKHPINEDALGVRLFNWLQKDIPYGSDFDETDPQAHASLEPRRPGSQGGL